MNKQEMIEKLKKNEKPFALLSKEEQDFLISLPDNTLECLQEWVPITWKLITQICWESRSSLSTNTFRIKPDYKPEPEKLSDSDIDKLVELHLDEHLFRKYTKTGLVFYRHPIILGPDEITGKKADKIILTRLDRYIERMLPTLYEMLTKIEGRRVLVDGAVPK